MASDEPSFVDRRAGDTVVNLLIGTAVATASSLVVPVGGQVLGGGVAGYLQQEGYGKGALVGGAAATLSTLPFVALFGLFVLPAILGPLASGFNEVSAAFAGVSLLVVGAMALAMVVPLAVAGALGGVVGRALFTEW